MKLKVNINTIEKAATFAQANTETDFDIDITSGRYVIDGKSLLGILSIKRDAPVEVDVHGGQSAEYTAYIEKLKDLNLLAVRHL